MKSSWLLYAGIALALSGVLLSLNSSDKGTSVAEDEKILVINQAYQDGQLISSDALYWRTLTEDELQQQEQHAHWWLAQSEQQQQEIEQQLVGSALRQPLNNDDALDKRLLVSPDDSGFLALTVRPGMRAVSVNIKLAYLSSGLVSPGDVVDLIITTQAQQVRASSDSVPSKRDFRTWRSAVAASGLRVLAINRFSSQNYEADQLNNNKRRRDRDAVVTFEATPQQAVRVPLALQMAANGGSLSISLRNPNDSGVSSAGSGASDLFPETKDSGLDENTFLIRGEQREVSGGL